MTGIEMLLKQFGIDPEALKKQFTEAAQKVIGELAEIKASQARMEARIKILYEAAFPDDVDDAVESGQLDSQPEGHGKVQ